VRKGQKRWERKVFDLEKRTTTFLASGFLGLRRNDSANGLIEDVFETRLGERRTFHIFDCSDVLGELVALFGSERSEFLLGKTLDSVLISAQIRLGTNDQDGCGRTVVRDFRVPFGTDILVRSRRDD